MTTLETLTRLTLASTFLAPTIGYVSQAQAAPPGAHERFRIEDARRALRNERGVKTNADAIADLRRRFDTAKTTVINKTVRVPGAARIPRKLQDTVNKLSTDYTTLSLRVDNLTTQLNANTAADSKYRAELELTIEGLNKTLEGIRSTVGGLTATMEDLAGKDTKYLSAFLGEVFKEDVSRYTSLRLTIDDKCDPLSDKATGLWGQETPTTENTEITLYDGRKITIGGPFRPEEESTFGAAHAAIQKLKDAYDADWNDLEPERQADEGIRKAFANGAQREIEKIWKTMVLPEITKYNQAAKQCTDARGDLAEFVEDKVDTYRRNLERVSRFTMSVLGGYSSMAGGFGGVRFGVDTPYLSIELEGTFNGDSTYGLGSSSDPINIPTGASTAELGSLDTNNDMSVKGNLSLLLGTPRLELGAEWAELRGYIAASLMWANIAEKQTRSTAEYLMDGQTPVRPLGQPHDPSVTTNGETKPYFGVGVGLEVCFGGDLGGSVDINACLGGSATVYPAVTPHDDRMKGVDLRGQGVLKADF